MVDFRLVIADKMETTVTSFQSSKKPVPSILVSYAYYECFAEIRNRMVFRDWMLDSGAYTAFTTGKEVDLFEYIEFCRKLKATDKTLSHILALDVIGDWKQSLNNYDTMRKAGIDIIPIYHLGAPSHVLKTLIAEYDYVAISGYTILRGLNSKRRYTDGVFNIAWPKKLHALGLGTEQIIKEYPWASADASSWALRPRKFGTLHFLGSQNVGQRNIAKHDLRAEVDHFLKIERWCNEKWQKELLEIGMIPYLETEGHNP